MLSLPTILYYQRLYKLLPYLRLWHELLTLEFVKVTRGYVKQKRRSIKYPALYLNSADLRLNNLKPEPLFQSYSH